MEDPIERKNQFLLIKKEFYEYVISVPKKNLPAGWNGGIYRIPYNEIERFYDAETGFKLNVQLTERTETKML